MHEATATDLANKLSAGRAASHEVVSAPLGSGQMGLGGGGAVPGESPGGDSDHGYGPSQLHGSCCNGECQLQVASDLIPVEL